MKKDQYFNLEVNLLNDDNIAGMMSELDAAEALGIYVLLLLHLRTKDNYEASCTPLLLRAFASCLCGLQRGFHSMVLSFLPAGSRTESGLFEL